MKLGVVAFLLLSGFVLSGCSHAPSSQSPAKNEQPSSSVTQDVGEQVITLTAKDFQFSAPEIRVKQHQKVKMVITNEGGFHDFIIDELRVNTGIIPAGGSKEVVIPTEVAGEFAFYCSVSNHRSRGMQGKLIIEEVAQ